MSTINTKKVVAAIPGVLVIGLTAGLLTYGGMLVAAELKNPKYSKAVVVTEVKEEPAKTETPAPAPVTTPVAAPAPAPTQPTATTNSFVYLRPTASTLGQPLKDLQAGTVVQYETKSSGLWQKVTVDGVTGYVYKKWLTY